MLQVNGDFLQSNPDIAFDTDQVLLFNRNVPSQTKNPLEIELKFGRNCIFFISMFSGINIICLSPVFFLHAYFDRNTNPCPDS
jgi:hypothetical protein